MKICKNALLFVVSMLSPFELVVGADCDTVCKQECAASEDLDECVSNCYNEQDECDLHTFSGHNPAEHYPLLRCQGDCDKNRQCKGDLICFQRDKGEDVPGCSNGAASKKYDYCARPEDVQKIYDLEKC